ncbi:hypothetical protein WJX73_009253 [Symbiochloris irregularis]|uniref:Acetyltransferase component of pyruvate dehydrogenase complex n=1 Tax=Symbiochloris irregularis TaxID=706552 RepID=A0AAW1PQA0_9CHLO
MVYSPRRQLSAARVICRLGREARKTGNEGVQDDAWSLQCCVSVTSRLCCEASPCERAPCCGGAERTAWLRVIHHSRGNCRRLSRRPTIARGALGSRRGYADYPPHTAMEMPALSPTMSQGNITSWKKKEGEEFAAGDVLCEVETDKATMEWEAQDEGVMAKILMGDGSQDVSVGTVVAVICEDKGDVAAFKDYKAGAAPSSGQGSGKEASSKKEEETPQPKEEEASAPPSSGGGGGGNFPPHTVMALPALSPTMSQGNIAAWTKKEGEAVAAGDSIADIETDKATMTWEAQDEGFVAKILVQAGVPDVQVGAPVAVFVEEEGDIGAFSSFTVEDASGAPPPKQESKEKAPEPKKEAPPKEDAPSKASDKGAEAPKAPPPKKTPSGGRVVASPYARKLAREAGVDVSQAQATGPEGRIVAADVQKLISSGGGKPSEAGAEASGAEASGAPAAAADSTQEGSEWTDQKNSNIRKVTAKRLLESKTTIPHYYLTIECEVDRLMAARAQLNERLAKEGVKVSVNDFLVKAAALALKKVPEVNASWHTDYIRQYHNVDVSVAVQTPAGLMVPVVRGADNLGLKGISSTVKALATKAKEGKLQPDEFSGGTFTVSNLGMYGVSQFSAIINPPQVAILAVGATEKRVVALPAGGFGEASILSATLSCDHRVVDGALGAQWLAAFRTYIEDPMTMLL